MKPRIKLDPPYWKGNISEIVRLHYRLKKLNITGVDVISLNPREDRGAVARRLQRHFRRDLQLDVRVFDNGHGFTVTFPPVPNSNADLGIPSRLRIVIEAALPRHCIRKFEFYGCL
ncbi:MAG: hypothetical protein SFV32_09255 [Opitutaceae bacterium]|nr:hypothetical protein [Opitutaceae bacterium]